MINTVLYSFSFDRGDGRGKSEWVADLKKVLSVLLAGDLEIDILSPDGPPTAMRVAVRAGIETAIGRGITDPLRQRWRVRPAATVPPSLILSVFLDADRTILVRGAAERVPAGHLLISSSEVPHASVQSGRSAWCALRVDAAAISLPGRVVERLLDRGHTLDARLRTVLTSAMPRRRGPADEIGLDTLGFDRFLTGLADLLLRSIALRQDEIKAESLLQRDLQQFILRNLDDHKLSADYIAAAHSISRRHLYQLFHRNSELSVAEYIRHARLEKARRLLADPARRDLPVWQIAKNCGFVSAAHFSRVFRATFGSPPAVFRREAWSAQDDGAARRPGRNASGTA